jgi:hypothetical protein
MRHTFSLAMIGWTATLILSSGCQSLTSTGAATKKSDSSWWPWSSKQVYQEPSSMSVIWADDVLMAPGQPATRGFGGRVYFYNERSQAIPVDGELTVYGYDDTESGERSKHEQPDKRFRFSPEQFTTHFTQGELGASYSVWLPWDEAGGPRRRITLIPVFKTTSGRLVRGEASTVTLSGKAPELTINHAQHADIRAAAFTGLPTTARDSSPFGEQIRSFSSENRRPGMTSTTISLPSSTQQQLKRSPSGSELQASAAGSGAGLPPQINAVSESAVHGGLNIELNRTGIPPGHGSEGKTTGLQRRGGGTSATSTIAPANTNQAWGVPAGGR